MVLGNFSSGPEVGAGLSGAHLHQSHLMNLRWLDPVLSRQHPNHIPPCLPQQVFLFNVKCIKLIPFRGIDVSEGMPGLS